jgi:hypothetical protein
MTGVAAVDDKSDTPPPPWATHSFAYSPVYGYAAAAVLFESMMRAKQARDELESGTADPAGLYFADQSFAAHFCPGDPRDPRDPGDKPARWRHTCGPTDAPVLCHTWGFAGAAVSGRWMARFASRLYTQHHDLLEFIYEDDKLHIVRANDRNVTPSGASAATTLRYRYSYGCWLPDLYEPSLEVRAEQRRYVAGIGMFGQMMLLDIDSGAIAVRRHTVNLKDIGTRENAHATFFRDAHRLFVMLEAVRTATTPARIDAVMRIAAGFAESDQ